MNAPSTNVTGPVGAEKPKARRGKGLKTSPVQAESKPSTRVTEDGMRYKAKPPVSPFGNTIGKGFGLAQMSCFKCGAHRIVTELHPKRILGKIHRVCIDGCKKG